MLNMRETAVSRTSGVRRARLVVLFGLVLGLCSQFKRILELQLEDPGNRQTGIATSAGDDQPSATRADLRGLIDDVHQVHLKLPYRKHLSPPPHPHPFAGALDENQRWGYVHDAARMRNNAPNSKAVKCHPQSQNSTMDFQFLIPDGAEVLQRIRRNLVFNLESASHGRAKVLCVVYTHEKNAAQINAVIKTWGSRCDGFLAASDHTDASIGAVHIPHFGEEGKYSSIWQKVRSTLAYVYMNYRKEYDIFHICGDDAFVIIENLKQFVLQKHVQSMIHRGEPLFAGGRIFPNWANPKIPKNSNFSYAGGGPGYSMNRAALDKFVEFGLAQCHPNEDLSYEDLLMGLCFRQLMGADFAPFKTTDSINASRYHHEDPNNIVNVQNDKRLQQFVKSQRRLRIKHLGEPRNPSEAVSNTSIAFHLVKDPKYMFEIDRVLYPCLDNPV